MAMSWFHRARSLKQRKSRQQAKRRRTTLSLERLDERAMLSVTAWFSPDFGNLMVFGDNKDNEIVASRNAAGAILLNGGAIHIMGSIPTVANTNIIQVFGQAGNDRIALDEANGILPRAILLGGAGDDTLTGGSNTDSLYGGAGVDTLLFNGSNANEFIDVSANGSRVRFFRDVANVTMDLNGLEQIDFNALGGADSVVVNDLTGTGVATVNVDLASTAGSHIADGQVGHESGRAALP